MATVDVLLDKVKDMAPTLRRYTEEAETARRLSRPVVDAMLKAGLYSMARPKAFGGLELDPVTMFRVVEEVARHDSAAGWTLQLSLAVDSCLAWLPDEGAAEILDGHPEVIFGRIVHSHWWSGDPSGRRLPSDRAVALCQRCP